MKSASTSVANTSHGHSVKTEALVDEVVASVALPLSPRPFLDVEAHMDMAML